MPTSTGKPRRQVKFAHQRGANGGSMTASGIRRDSVASDGNDEENKDWVAEPTDVGVAPDGVLFILPLLLNVISPNSN